MKKKTLVGTIIDPIYDIPCAILDTGDCCDLQYELLRFEDLKVRITIEEIE
jgi:hypothetical protein